MQVFDRSEPFSRHVLGAVAVGGALGAAGRWAIVVSLDAVASTHVRGTWAWATLIVNVVGSLAIGFAARRIARDSVAWAFVVTGVLGGFTTFSALAVELNDLADADRMPMAVAYGAVTIAAGVAATAVAQRSRAQPGTSAGSTARHAT